MKSPIWLPFGLKPKEKPPQEGPRYADIYERGMAAAVDVTLLYLLLGNFFDYFTALLYHKADRDLLIASQHTQSSLESAHYVWQSGLLSLWMLNTCIQLAIIGVFILGCQFTWNTTPGKWVFGISIRRRSDLALPERWRYIVRYLAYIPSAFVFFVISFNRQRRGLHDKIAGTVVIHTRPEGWYWQQVKALYARLRGRQSDAPVE